MRLATDQLNVTDPGRSVFVFERRGSILSFGVGHDYRWLESCCHGKTAKHSRKTKEIVTVNYREFDRIKYRVIKNNLN